MIEKMQFISLTGPKEDFDRVVDRYIPRYNIQLENALVELKSVKNLRPFNEPNVYKDLFQSGVDCLSQIGTVYTSGKTSMSVEQARNLIRLTKNELSQPSAELSELSLKLKEKEDELETLAHYKNIHVNLKQLGSFKFLTYHFGRLPLIYYKKFEKYILDDLDTIFYLSSKDETYAYGIYFSPSTQAEKLDAIYSSLHFEIIDYSNDYDGDIEENYERILNEATELRKQCEALKKDCLDIIDVKKDKLLEATRRLELTRDHFELRKLAACTGNADDNYMGFYILCGWLSLADAKKLEEECKKDDSVSCILEELDGDEKLKPPTKLKNFPLFRPFEMFVRMYGMPSYDEFDPTPIVAITYSLIFGAMFGDLGQGLCLFLLGLLIYLKKKSDLAAIISMCGLSSSVFGCLFGSVFGFEDIIPALWLKPTLHMTSLNFVGRLNTVFIVAVAFGMGITLFCIVMNIISNIRARRFEEAFLDPNGLTGFVFYASIVLVIVLFTTGKPLPASIVLALMFGLPLLLIVLKEPIMALITKKPMEEKTGVGMFITQAFFELFEILLSYFSNTLSFIRIGAFAISHASMMEVVLMLAGAHDGGKINILVVILGNIFVSGMEGLIVGIQVLRLQFYEMFSRYFKGNGREFRSTIV